MEIIKNSFHINSLKINQRTLCVHVCIGAHRNIYTCSLYTCVYVCVYIYTCINVYTHICLKCVYVYLRKKQTSYSSLKEYSENIKMILAEEKGRWKFR